MTKRSSVLLIAVVVAMLAGTMTAMGATAKARRHAGTVVTVNPSARTLVVRELVEAGKPKSLNVKVPQESRVVVSERVPSAEISDLRNPFRETAIDLGEVRRGDTVVLESTRERGAEIASQVIVTLRASGQ
jgi:hypothetical protein